MTLPILQVEAGKFYPPLDGKLCLAILHSRKLVLAILQKSQENVSYTGLCEHAFDRNAYNMVQGLFGGFGRSVICV